MVWQSLQYIARIEDTFDIIMHSVCDPFLSRTLMLSMRGEPIYMQNHSEMNFALLRC